MSLRLFELLRHLPGYTRESLMREDGRLLDDWWTYLTTLGAVDGLRK